MKKKTKELIRDIIFMIWGFVGSCLTGFLLLNNDLHMITGNTILTIGRLTDSLLTSIGIVFIISLIVICVMFWLDKSSRECLHNLKWKK